MKSTCSAGNREILLKNSSFLPCGCSSGHDLTKKKRGNCVAVFQSSSKECMCSFDWRNFHGQKADPSKVDFASRVTLDLSIGLNMEADLSLR